MYNQHNFCEMSLYIRQTLICIKDKQNLENVKNLTVNVVMLMQLHVEEKKIVLS